MMFLSRKKTGWIVDFAFENLHKKFPTLPFGFGCVALYDLGAPGFPTFPVVHKTHFSIFDQIVPSEFVNQDGDPFLFQIYRRWGASVFLEEVQLRNAIGGVQLFDDSTFVTPRYERQHIQWQFELLDKALEKVVMWMKEEQQPPPRRVVLDVITPSFRVSEELLMGILNLRVPEYCETCFIVIVDNPKANIAWLRELERNRVGQLRVRKNPSNEGAAMSRNIGLAESSADWVLFLDDDVIPSPTILAAYAEAIRSRGNDTDGFVGATILPKEPRVFPTAVHLAGLTYFWDISHKMPRVPWGVTANILFRRSKIAFDSSFIKTGGGEDIDYCLQPKRYPLLSVPAATATHPWWANGNRCYSHFFRWAIGDSLLIDKYPNLSYYAFGKSLCSSFFFFPFWGGE